MRACCFGMLTKIKCTTKHYRYNIFSDIAVVAGLGGIPNHMFVKIQ